MIKISISAVRLHHTYLALVERNVPRLSSIFPISRSFYFHLIIIKVLIFVFLISRFFFIFLPHRHHQHLFLHIRISQTSIQSIIQRSFKPLAAERAKKLDDITGNWTWQRWVEKWKRWTKRILLLLFMMMIRMLLFSIWWGGWEWGWWLQLKQNCKRKHADQVESAPNINQLKPEEVEEVGGQVLAQPPQVLIYPIKF